MRLATLPDGRRDGRLVVVSADLRRYLPAPDKLPTLQAALDDWDVAVPALREVERRLATGAEAGFALDAAQMLAPLPRAYQWVDGSTYLTHMERLRRARGVELPPDHRREPVAYQSGSDRFLAPREPIPAGEEAWCLDIEATVAVVTGDVPAGTPAERAAEHIRLVLLANDLTYRHLLPAEMAKGVGLYQAKPARPLSPVAVTPDALGAAWDGGRLHATVECHVNGEPLGALDSGADCAFHFGELIAHLTRTRSLAAGTLVGSGTISNRDPARGFGCLAEKRAVELLDGDPSTRFLRPGDTLRIEALDQDGASLFGAMEHRVVDGIARHGGLDRLEPGGERSTA